MKTENDGFNGTFIYPTVSDTISTSGVAISTGTAVHNRPVMNRIAALLLMACASSWGAVTVDAVALGQTEVVATSIAWTHVCAAGAVLFVGIVDRGAGGQDTGVTANCTALTFVARINQPTNIAVYKLLNCSGSQSIVTAQDFGFLSGNSISFLGAAQTGQPNASATNTTGTNLTAGSNYATSVTSTVPNCVTLQFTYENFGSGAVMTAGAGTTVKQANGSTYPEIAISSTAVAAGSSTQNLTSNATETIWSVIVAVAPATAPSTFQAFIF